MTYFPGYHGYDDIDDDKKPAEPAQAGGERCGRLMNTPQGRYPCDLEVDTSGCCPYHGNPQPASTGARYRAECAVLLLQAPFRVWDTKNLTIIALCYNEADAAHIEEALNATEGK